MRPKLPPASRPKDVTLDRHGRVVLEFDPLYGRIETIYSPEAPNVRDLVLDEEMWEPWTARIKRYFFGG